MKKNHIIIEVDGGVVQSVYSDDPNVDVQILDHDVADVGDLTEDEVREYESLQKSVESMFTIY